MTRLFPALLAATLTMPVAMICPAQPVGFTAPERVTASEALYRLSRTADQLMAVDSEGVLHFTYWSGGLATTPGTPSFVFYRSWRPNAGWSPQVAIDDSTFGANHVGGRHPCLAVTDSDDVWVVWHDHRHSIPGGNWINNTEIYADRKPKGGTFSSTDIRLTTTSAAHAGDNGYAPRIAAAPDGALNVVWYDYTADRFLSDLYLKTSDITGQFDPGEPIASLALTHGPVRGGSPSFTVPALAIDGMGTRHLVWGSGLGIETDLYYGEVPAGGTSVSESVIAAGGADFNDPPHIGVSPAGDVWVAFGNGAGPGGENVTLMRRGAGQAGFDAPIEIAPDAARQYAPDMAFDSQGNIHLVWIDERQGRRVLYGVYDPSLAAFVVEEPLTGTPGMWSRPSIESNAEDNLYVVWEEEVSSTQGAIWFSTTRGPDVSGVSGWELYR